MSVIELSIENYILGRMMIYLYKRFMCNSDHHSYLIGIDYSPNFFSRENKFNVIEKMENFGYISIMNFKRIGS